MVNSCTRFGGGSYLIDQPDTAPEYIGRIYLSGYTDLMTEGQRVIISLPLKAWLPGHRNQQDMIIYSLAPHFRLGGQHPETATNNHTLTVLPRVNATYLQLSNVYI